MFIIIDENFAGSKLKAGARSGCWSALVGAGSSLTVGESSKLLVGAGSISWSWLVPVCWVWPLFEIDVTFFEIDVTLFSPTTHTAESRHAVISPTPASRVFFRETQGRFGRSTKNSQDASRCSWDSWWVLLSGLCDLPISQLPWCHANLMLKQFGYL